MSDISLEWFILYLILISFIIFFISAMIGIGKYLQVIEKQIKESLNGTSLSELKLALKDISANIIQVNND